MRLGVKAEVTVTQSLAFGSGCSHGRPPEASTCRPACVVFCDPGRGFSPVAAPSGPWPVPKRALVRPFVLDAHFFPVFSPRRRVRVPRSFYFQSERDCRACVAAVAACSLSQTGCLVWRHSTGERSDALAPSPGAAGSARVPRGWWCPRGWSWLLVPGPPRQTEGLCGAPRASVFGVRDGEGGSSGGAGTGQARRCPRSDLGKRAAHPSLPSR